MEGIFSGDNKVFKLSNTENINQRWRGKAYSELTDEQRRIIRTSPIHAIIFEQKQPQNDTGMYQISVSYTHLDVYKRQEEDCPGKEIYGCGDAVLLFLRV